MRKLVRTRTLLLALGGVLGGIALSFATRTTQAADHIDFPEEVLDPVSDIVDVFAFSSPSTPGNLVLVLNTHTFAGPESQFSDKLEYTFRLRRASIDGEGAAAVVKTPAPEEGGEEFRIGCRFRSHNVICRVQRVDDDEQVFVARAPVATAGRLEQPSAYAGGSNEHVRVFAGLRADPFYLDFQAATATLLPPGPQRDQFRQSVGIEDLDSTLVMPRDNPVNFAEGKNVLSIVVEVDVDAVFGPGSSLFAVTAETNAVEGSE